MLAYIGTFKPPVHSSKDKFSWPSIQFQTFYNLKYGLVQDGHIFVCEITSVEVGIDGGYRFRIDMVPVLWYIE